MARNPEPIEKQLLKAKGDGRTPGHRRVDIAVPIKGGPLGKRKIPDPPEGLLEHGKAEWLRIWTEGREWLWPSDGRWVEMAAKAVDRADRYQAQIDKDGDMVAGARPGQLVANSLIKDLHAVEAVYREVLRELSLSPIARRRAGMAEVKQAGALADFQDRVDKRKAEWESSTPGFGVTDDKGSTDDIVEGEIV